MALIFYMSSRPAPEEVKWLPIIAKLKLVHIIEYGLLYFLYWWALRKTTMLYGIEMFALAFMMMLIYGLIDEFHQIYVIGRTAKLIDVVADVVGAVLAQLVLISRKIQRIN